MQTSACAIYRGQRGAMNIILSVVLMVGLGTIAGLTMSTADRSLFGSHDFTRQTATFMLAEGAIEDGLAKLDKLSDWSTLQLPKEDYTQPRALGRGIIWSDVFNDAADPGGSKDTNGYLLVRGYGRHNNTDPARGVEVLYWRPTFILPPAAAVIICGQDYFDGANGNTLVSGYNHELPPAPCSGSACNAVRSEEEPDVAGVSFEDPDHVEDVDLPEEVEGVPPILAPHCALQGKTGLCARMRLSMKNVDRLVGVQTLTSWPVSGKASYGSVTDPKLIRVAKGTTLKLSGTTQGAGVMLVEGTLDQVGTFTWTGVIVIGPGGILDLRGTANIFGGVVTAGDLYPTSSARKASLKMRGNGSVVWAGDAAQVGPFNLPGLIISWREFALPRSL